MQKGNFSIKGKYRFIKTNAVTGEVISTSEWIPNLIMKDDTLGINLIIRRLGNDLTYDCIITSAEIGTGTTAPADTDTDLATPVVTGILPALQAIATDNVTISFFIPSANLANGTYKEFLLRCGTKAFARSIINPNYVKGTNEDTTVEYLITANNA